MLRRVRLVSVFALVLAAAGSGQMPALERFHDVLPAQDFAAGIHAVAEDFDGDGDVDVAGGGPYETYAVGKRLWLNDGDAVFAQAAGAFPMEFHPQPSLDLLAADFDGDGLPDVFESRSGFSDPSGDALFHNLGGAFADVSDILPAGAQSTFGVVLDHDQDGDLDLFANGGRDRLIENLGGLQFMYSGVALPVGPEAEAAAAGDLDGDGLTDILRISALSGQVLLNQGGSFVVGGSFDPVFFGPFLPPVVELADLDGDQDLDAVVGSGDVVLAANDGFASFAAQRLASPQYDVLSIAAGDVDGDLDQDLVVASGNSVLYSPGSVSLYRNDGALAFAAFPFPNLLEAAASDFQRGLLADLDGDQDLDYLRSGGRVVFGDGQGHFASLDDGLLWSYGTALGDLEGDGDLDLFQVEPLRVQRAGPAGLEPPVLIPFPGSGLSAGDLDLDGDADLLAGFLDPYGPPVPALYLGNGSGTFSVGTAGLPGISGHFESRLADVDGDGDLDGLLATLIENQGGANFTDASVLLPALADYHGAEFADLDGDGDLDLVLAANRFELPNHAQLLRNDGPQGFVDVTGSQLSQRGSETMALGDVDADGDQDLVFVGDGQDTLQENDGAGFFTDVTPSSLPPEHEYGVAATLFDPDGDGDLDLYVANASSVDLLPSHYGEAIQLLANDGSGVFLAEDGVLPEGFLPPYIPRPPAADFDRDGDVDLHVGDPVGLLANTTRHLAWAKPPRLGRTLGLALRGDPSTPWLLLAATKAAEIPLGEFGILGVDPSHPVILKAGHLDASGEGEAAFAVPADPTLVGASLFWQGLVGMPRRLTNVERTTFTDF